MTESLFARYEAGNRRDVWAELHALGSLVDKPATIREDAVRVCDQTMERAAHNVRAIYNYLEETEFPFEYREYAFAPANEATLGVLSALESMVGLVPPTIQAWFRHVGIVCLRRKSKVDSVAADLLDPLEFMYSPGMLDEDLVEIEGNGDAEAGATTFGFQFAGDVYNKNDISGGAPSHIVLPSDTVDGIVVENDFGSERTIWFVDYLREYFAGGGFRRLGNTEHVADRRVPDLGTSILEI